VRTVAGRIEWRLPDPSCNVYAAIASTLLAGLMGIEQAMVPPPPCAEDLYERRAAGLPMPPRLPSSLGEALDALQADTALCERLGPAFCAQFLHIKRAEWDAYSLHVSEWEMQRYANAF